MEQQGPRQKKLTKAEAKKDNQTKPGTRQAKKNNTYVYVNLEIVYVTESSDSEIEDLVSYVGDKRKNTSTSSSGENSHSPPCGPIAQTTSSSASNDRTMPRPRNYHRRKKSIIWGHVEKTNNGLQCKHCKKFWPNLLRRGSTSSCRKHLIQFHWDRFSEE